MGKRLTDDQKQSIISRYDQGLQRTQISLETGVSEGSVNRVISQYKQSKTPEAIATEAQSAIAHVVAQQLRPESVKDGHLDMDGSLLTIINAMVSKMNNTESRSSEGCAATVVRAIALYRQYHPQTMEELADRLLELPDFDPAKFVQILKRKIELMGQR